MPYGGLMFMILKKMREHHQPGGGFKYLVFSPPTYGKDPKKT